MNSNKNINMVLIAALLFSCFLFISNVAAQHSRISETSSMLFGDTTRLGVPFAKDPHVIRFDNRYLMYYSIPGSKRENGLAQGWGIGIAESYNLVDWTKVGEVNVDKDADYEAKGFAAPSAIVLNDTVHLFYQTYGNWTNDAICHAWSADGIYFVRNSTNPVFKPSGKWNAGRAIDAEIMQTNDRFLLYYATRDPDMKIQQIGVASVPVGTSFNRDSWDDLSTDGPILYPEFSWEDNCVEGASVVIMDDLYFMFYAGAYNNHPQQVGVAKSLDGINWEKLSDKPFLSNGETGSWNSSESGHPHLFKDFDGKTYLFYQGNNDNGKTWYISQMQVFWNKKGPFIQPE